MSRGLADETHAGMARRAATLAAASLDDLARRTDRLFAGLLVAEWLAGIALALWLAPLTWAGLSSALHPHVAAACVLGTLIAALPVALALVRPGEPLTRHVVAAGQMLLTGLLVQLSGGRIETHFLVFGSLAFLAFYRDVGVLLTASAVTLADHAARGLLWPQSVYGVSDPTVWRTLEHAGWVVFIDVFLAVACRRGVAMERAGALRQAELEHLNRNIEHVVMLRTAELRASEARFRTLAAASPVGIFETDAAGSFTWVNPRFEAITGLPAESALGSGWSRSLAAAERAPAVAAWQGCVLQSQDLERSLALDTGDGSERWTAWRATAVRSEAGVVRGWVGTVEDVTERRRVERELRAARDAAEALARARQEFLATMSHEVRTPLNGVIGMTGLLLESRLDDQQRECAEVIRSSGQALLHLVNDVLDVSRIESGRMQLEVVEFDLRDMVQESVEMVADRAHARGLELTWLVQPDVPDRLRGDPARLRQVLLNLLSNAVKFTGRGEVALRVRLAVPGAPQGGLRFEVRDTGPGLDPALRARLFQPFVQGDASATRRHGGAGLGLAISRRFVELMGGSLGVDSEPGLGSTFWLVLPLAPVPGAAPAGPRPNLAGRRVLVIDDFASSRSVLRTHLEAWGLRVDEADGLESATECLRERPGRPAWDALLVDLDLGGASGRELVRRARADAGLARSLVVLMAAPSRPGLAEEARAAGCDGWLSKPVAPAALAAALSGPGPRREPAPSSAPLPAGRVLVVEDNEVNQRVLLRLLERLGQHTDVAADGLEALEATARRPYDLVLMDLQMPGMDGLAATRALREREAREGGRLRIVALTANAYAEDRERCRAAGMDGFLAKPVSLAQLRELLAGRPDGPGDRADPPAGGSRRGAGGAEVAEGVDVDDGGSDPAVRPRGSRESAARG